MSGYPWYVFVILPLALGYVIWSRRRLAGHVAANADKNVGAVATRLGLSVVEGDGNVNLLYFQQPSGDFSRKIRATGQPYGRPISLTIMDGQKTSEFIVARKITTSFGCFLEAETSVQFPPFELSLRQPNQYLVPNLEFAERPELKETPAGNPQLDGLFLVRAADPRTASLLVPALNILSTQLYVHLAGEGNRIWISFSRIGLPYFAGSPEEFLLALETAACALEGRPVPARIGQSPAQVRSA